MRVMVIEDDPATRSAIAGELAGDRELELTSDAEAIRDRIAAGRADWDVVVVDDGADGAGGLDLLHQLRAAGAFASVIVVARAADPDAAAEYARAGAFCYLTRPLRSPELASVVDAAASHSRLRRQLHGGGSASAAPVDDAADPLMIGVSAGMRRLRATVTRLAGQDVAVWIRGERGAGKTLVARALHDRGPRRARPFVTLDCAAIPPGLLDAELFGSARGALAQAAGGTLLLEEISELPLASQGHLARVLEAGGDARLLAATGVDLEAAAAAGRFDPDLHRQLTAVVIDVPPLRERLDDLPLLVAHFLRKHGGPARPGLAREALAVMLSHSWPGNVRELEQAVMHASALHHGGAIGPESLPAHIATSPPAAGSGLIPLPPGDAEGLPLTAAKRRASAAYERGYLLHVMARAKGSVSEAARLAGLDRTNFRRLLQRHGLDPAGFR